ncbi:hypothetical protein E4634_20515 [Mangrovimicrobium sediminis]|uniref:Uncharacterized protein n=1 Tax=Mangrovimicrobium sediminis TaxID=2562682 RepID=A0A4Z0LVA2_9GAMM|nr:hypothetical protein [Haliea sp. SAOS-164]TGD70985.1 hypothetical protein E4634_20515 [Haliea sp. SAOS-164]
MQDDYIQEPITETSLSLYFKQRLSEYARRLRPPPHEDTCWYIGSMLERFGRTDHLFAYDNGQYGLRPLALLYGDALEARNEHERCLILQQLGDMALFLGALFPERFTRRGIQQDYVAGMGGSAYDYLADNARRNRHIFAELSHMFTRMLEMVASACTQDRHMGTEDIIALYQHWLDTGDPLAESRLRGLGIALSSSERMH